jgi:hypothetical protein
VDKTPQNEFEREKVSYEQNFEQARSLNAQMNQIPTLAITLTGGLWFAAGVTERMQTPMRFGLLIFAGLCDIGLVLAILRVRDVFHSYLEKLKAFYPQSYVEGRPEQPKIGRLGDYSMVTVYALLMFSASLLSLFGAFTFYWPFQPRTMPLGIVVAIASLATLYTFLYYNWKYTALIAFLGVTVLALAACWILRYSGGV